MAKVHAVQEGGALQGSSPEEHSLFQGVGRRNPVGAAPAAIIAPCPLVLSSQRTQETFTLPLPPSPFSLGWHPTTTTTTTSFLQRTSSCCCASTAVPALLLLLPSSTSPLRTAKALCIILVSKNSLYYESSHLPQQRNLRIKHKIWENFAGTLVQVPCLLYPEMKHSWRWRSE